MPPHCLQEPVQPSLEMEHPSLGSASSVHSACTTTTSSSTSCSSSAAAAAQPTRPTPFSSVPSPGFRGPAQPWMFAPCLGHCASAPPPLRLHRAPPHLSAARTMTELLPPAAHSQGGRAIHATQRQGEEMKAEVYEGLLVPHSTRTFLGPEQYTRSVKLIR